MTIFVKPLRAVGIIGLFTFSVLSGKYIGGVRPTGVRITLFERFDCYTKNKSGVEATEAYVQLQYGLEPAQMARQQPLFSYYQLVRRRWNN